MVSLVNVRVFASRFVSLLVASSSLSACHNYTSAPVCTDANAVNPPGITGVYTLSMQDEEFNVHTQEFSVMPGESGRLAIRRVDGSEEEARLCQVGGHVIQETYEERVQGYSQERLYVTNMGITLLPLFYDRAALDQSGVRYKIFEVPTEARAILGERLVGLVETLVSRVAGALEAEAELGLMVDNGSVAPGVIAAASHAGPVGLTFLRK